MQQNERQEKDTQQNKKNLSLNTYIQFICMFISWKLKCSNVNHRPNEMNLLNLSRIYLAKIVHKIFQIFQIFYFLFVHFLASQLLWLVRSFNGIKVKYSITNLMNWTWMLLYISFLLSLSVAPFKICKSIFVILMCVCVYALCPKFCMSSFSSNFRFVILYTHR